MNKNRTETLLFALLVVWAAFTRFAQLGVGYIKNETAFYQIGVDLFQRKYDTIMTWPYVSSLYCYFCALFFPLTGPEMWVFRYVCAALGMLTVLFTYWFGKKLYGRKVAFIAAFLLTVSFWQMSLNRQGSLPLDSVFTIAALYFYYRNYETKKWIHCAVAGLILGAGAHIKPYLLQIFAVMTLATLVLEGWKRAAVNALVTGAAVVLALWPVILWNVRFDFPMAKIYGSSLGGESVMGQVHFHDSRKIYEEIPQKLFEYFYAIRGSLNGSLSATGPALPGGIPPFRIFPLLYALGTALSVRGALKNRNRRDVYSTVWFFVNLIAFTFLITWPEDAGEDLTKHRPPRYFNAVYPMPLYMVGLAFVFLFDKAGAALRARPGAAGALARTSAFLRSRAFKTAGGAALAVAVAVLSFGMYQKFKAIAPQSSANLDSLNRALAEREPNARLLTNFFIGDLKQVKTIYYPLTFRDFLDNDFKMPEDGRLRHSDTRDLMYLYPYFLYARAPESVRIVYRKGRYEMPGVFSLTDLPIYGFDALEGFPHEGTGKTYAVYAVLWDKRSGDALERIIGMHDYPHEYRYDADLFEAANPGLKPQREWLFHGRREFATYKKKIEGRRYRELRLDFGSRALPAAAEAIKVNRGALYEPWVGFGWKHPFMNETVYDPNPQGEIKLDSDGIGMPFVNEFYVDVPDGEYKASVYLRHNCHPAADIDAEGVRVFRRDRLSSQCGPVDFGRHSLVPIQFNTRVTDGQLTLRFDPDHEFSPMEHTEPGLGSFVGLEIRKNPPKAEPGNGPD